MPEKSEEKILVESKFPAFVWVTFSAIVRLNALLRRPASGTVRVEHLSKFGAVWNNNQLEHP